MGPQFFFRLSPWFFFRLLAPILFLAFGLRFFFRPDVFAVSWYTYDYVHVICATATSLNFVHGFAGQYLTHGSFFKDWQGMVRGYIEAKSESLFACLQA